MAGPCNHTLHHATEDGRLQGSWSRDLVTPTKIVCSECGRFYGYLRHGKRPRPTLAQYPNPTDPAPPSVVSRPPSMEECELPRSQRRELLDFRTLRSLIPASRILELIQWTPLQERGPQLRGACPLHESKSSRPRSFSVNVEKGTFQCFGCGKKGNHIDLYREVTGLDIYEASMQLCQTLGIDPPFLERERQ